MSCRLNGALHTFAHCRTQSMTSYPRPDWLSMNQSIGLFICTLPAMINIRRRAEPWPLWSFSPKSQWKHPDLVLPHSCRTPGNTYRGQIPVRTKSAQKSLQCRRMCGQIWSRAAPRAEGLGGQRGRGTSRWQSHTRTKVWLTCHLRKPPPAFR